MKMKERKKKKEKRKKERKKKERKKKERKKKERKKKERKKEERKKKERKKKYYGVFSFLNVKFCLCLKSDPLNQKLMSNIFPDRQGEGGKRETEKREWEHV